MPHSPKRGRLAGKVALITGADRRIGRATAACFAREGADIVLACPQEQHETAATTRRMILAEGQRCLLISGDIGSELFAMEAVEKAIRTFGQLDILVNNTAEEPPEQDLLAISSDQWEQTFRTNFFACVHFTKAALAYLREGASIINTTTASGYRGDPRLIDYAASKGAIISFTRSLADHLAARHIRVNAVTPGPLWAPPEAGCGRPDEVVQSYVFLASSGVGFTGQVLHPNGSALHG